MKVKLLKLLFSVDVTERLQIADARNMLFNWLFARHHLGQLIIRVDDQLPEGKIPPAISPLESLRWLGLDWDSEPGSEPGTVLKRSERLELYKQVAEKLVESGMAYRCFCSKETLRDMTNAQKIHGQTPKYDGRCLRLSLVEQLSLVAKGTPYQIRLKKPEVVSEVHDLVRGRMVFDPAGVADLIVFKSDGIPSFALAGVVDHHHLGITHLMRGDRFQAETPREAFLRQALGWKSPEYIHLPLILGEDRSLLSERHGDKYVEEYRASGYMPEAMLNYLLSHGFPASADEQLRSSGTMVKAFKVESIQQDPSIWQLEKLQFMNRLALDGIKDDALATMLAPYVKAQGYDLFARGDVWAKDFVAAIRPSLNILADVKDSIDVFFLDRVVPDKKSQTLLKDPDAKKVVEALEGALEKVTQITPTNYRELMDAARQSIPAKSKALVLVRVALTGRDVGPDFSKLFVLLGKELVLARLENSRRYIPKGMKREF